MLYKLEDPISIKKLVRTTLTSQRQVPFSRSWVSTNASRACARTAAKEIPLSSHLDCAFQLQLGPGAAPATSLPWGLTGRRQRQLLLFSNKFKYQILQPRIDSFTFSCSCQVATTLTPGYGSLHAALTCLKRVRPQDVLVSFL
jgi:hypothetical protein